MSKIVVNTPLLSRTEDQAKEFSDRVKAGLARARENGKVLGARPGSSYLADYIREHGNAPAIKGIQAAAERYYKVIRPILREIRKENPKWSYAQMAKELERRGVRTRRGKTEWHATSVHRLCVLFDLV